MYMYMYLTGTLSVWCMDLFRCNQEDEWHCHGTQVGDLACQCYAAKYNAVEGKSTSVLSPGQVFTCTFFFLQRDRALSHLPCPVFCAWHPSINHPSSKRRTNAWMHTCMLISWRMLHAYAGGEGRKYRSVVWRSTYPGLLSKDSSYYSKSTPCCGDYASSEHTCMYACIHIYKYACMHTCIYACMQT